MISKYEGYSLVESLKTDNVRCLLKLKEEVESRADTNELGLHEVLEFNHLGVALVEDVKTVVPVLQSKECLLVRVEFCEDLLQKLGCHVEAD